MVSSSQEPLLPDLIPLSWLAAAALFLVLTTLWVSRSVQRQLQSKKQSRTVRNAYRQETAASALLEAEGFTVLQAQATHPWPIKIGDQQLEITLRVDYLVRRAGRLFVADVKTGAGNGVRNAATRRQLLEYMLAYGADGALLVDMDRRQVLEMEFPSLVVE